MNYLARENQGKYLVSDESASGRQLAKAIALLIVVSKI